jgi:hypothetical protein
MYTLEDVYKTFPSGATEDYKILRAFEMGKQEGGAKVKELEAQIEKMKCCGNCIHCYEGAYHNGYRCKDNARESVCDNWEMMTDEVRKEMLEDD